MSDQLEPPESMGVDSLDNLVLQPSWEIGAVKALPMVVPESVLQQVAEKRRIKKGILAESEEQRVFEKILYLPYLNFTYNYLVLKGLWSKQTVQGHGRSALLALREVDFGFFPELASLTHEIVDMVPEADSVIPGVDSTVLVNERLEELKLILSKYDDELLLLAGQYGSLARTDPTRQEIKDSIEHLNKTRQARWKMFADGLKLPSKMDLEALELVEGTLFYMPYFMVRFSQGRESRFFVWDRQGKENEFIADELAKNSKFRELVQSHAMS